MPIFYILVENITMKRLVYLLITVITFAFLGSCSFDDDDPNFRFETLRIISAELPDSFTLNETFQIEITYVKPSGCINFEGFDVTNIELTTREVVAVGTARTDLTCIGTIIEETSIINFIVLYDEPYIFRFWQGEGTDGEGEFLEIQVPVN